MPKLAIRGHGLRGREVIDLLTSLGAKGDNHNTGTFINRIYYINDDGFIESTDNLLQKFKFNVYTLDEFFKKYPYKVGDKVKLKHYTGSQTIQSMKWMFNGVSYKINETPYWLSAEELKSYNEENNSNDDSDEFKNKLETFQYHVKHIEEICSSLYGKKIWIPTNIGCIFVPYVISFTGSNLDKVFLNKGWLFDSEMECLKLCDKLNKAIEGVKP